MTVLCLVKFSDKSERIQMQMSFIKGINRNQNDRNHEQERTKHITAKKMNKIRQRNKYTLTRVTRGRC